MGWLRNRRGALEKWSGQHADIVARFEKAAF